jgi:hypothetical protein
MMLDAKTIRATQARMESDRAGFDTLRAEIASMILPHHSHFHARHAAQGAARNENLFDEWPALALEDGVAAFEGFVIPRGRKWQSITLHDETLMKPLEHQRWLESKEKLIFGMRNDPQSGFASNVHDSATMLMALGMQSMWCDKRFDAMGRFIGLSYQSEFIDDIWVERDAEGNPMRVHRKIKLTAEQAKAKWQDRAPPKVHEAMTASAPRPTEEFVFIHVIERNPAMKPGRIDDAGKPWLSCYYSEKDDLIFLTGGYRTLRRITSCFDRASNESYGRGRANLVLGALRACQVIMQDRVLGTEMMVKPPLLASDDDLDSGIIDLSPFGITYGGLDERGEPRLRTFLDAIDLSGARDLHGELRSIIDKVFYRDLLQLNREQKTHMSATRTMEEIAEKGILMAPLARQEGDWFSPLLNSELDLLWDEGLLDDMPPRLAAYFEAGGGVHVRYDNGVTRMQEAVEAAGYLRTAEQVGALAQFDNNVVADFRREFPLDRVLPALASINGVPASWRSTDAEKADFDEAQQQRIAAEQMLAAMPAIGQTARDLAQAGAMNSGG